MHRIAGVVIVGLLVPICSSTWGASFQGLGCQGCVAENVSADGSTVVGFLPLGLGFRWHANEGLITLPDLPGGDVRSSAKGVSSDGRFVAGGSSSNLGGEAYRWNAEDGSVGLGQHGGGSLVGTFAWGMSDDGSVVVGSAWGGSRPMRWTAQGGVELLANVDGEAFGVSGDGTTVVGTSVGANRDAFLWTVSDGMQLIGPGDARGASFDGSVVVGRDLDFGQAFRWTAQTGQVFLGDLPGGIVRSEAYDVSADGSVVVGWSATDESETAFIWDELNGMRDVRSLLTDLGVDMSGWSLNDVRGVSADGLTLVGSGTNPSGITEAWIAVIPEPSAGVLLFLGAMLFLYDWAAPKAHRSMPR